MAAPASWPPVMPGCSPYGREWALPASMTRLRGHTDQLDIGLTSGKWPAKPLRCMSGLSALHLLM